MKKFLFAICSLFILYSCDVIRQKQLEGIANKTTRSCPMQLNSETILNSVEASSNFTLIYNYTLKGVEAERYRQSIDDYFLKVLKQNMLSILRYSPDYKYVTKNEFSLNYNYYDEAGNFIYNILITPTDAILMDIDQQADNGEYPQEVYGVDLGLSVLWAQYNIGAVNVEDYGDYFVWGETEPKLSYASSVVEKADVDDISGQPTYDPATAVWGGNWRLPTRKEMEELINKCKWTWTEINGVNGFTVKGPNGNSIFLPAAGHRQWAKTSLNEVYGYYWTSTPYKESFYGSEKNTFTYALEIRKHGSLKECDLHYRIFGYSVRAVRNK